MNATSLQPTPPRATLALHTPAKINLTLRVLGKREDSFHELQSLVMGVDLCDHLDCSRAIDGDLNFHCSDKSLDSHDNLVLQAIKIIAQSHHITPAMKIGLTKRIPIGAGLGGGSSDAAATLHLCNELWNLQLNKTELANLGSTIGSDVPLFFSLPSAVIRGRGEIVEPQPLSWKGWVLLVQTGEIVSTPAVYGNWKKEDCAEMFQERLADIPSTRSASVITSLLFNDLESAVFRLYPAVAEIYTQLNSLMSGHFRLTGAGSVFYQLFDHREDAHNTVVTISERLPDVTCTVVAAPVSMHPGNE